MDAIELTDFEYYFLLVLMIIPVYLFLGLWAWMGWQLFKNN